MSESDFERLLRAMMAMQTRARSARAPSGGEVQRLRSDYVMVAAIDFGTTFSGYAFSFKKSQDSVIMNKNWGAGLGFGSYKTPTCVLLDPNQKFKAFGFEAQQEYAALVDNQDRSHYFFEKFKMKLHNNKLLTRNTTIDATNGKSMPAIKVFAMALRYLKGHLVSAVSAATEGSAAEDLIRWVLTVPAIWSDASKRFMREAACEAGLIDDVDSGRLLIALEPEAASLYCRKLTISQFVGKPGGSELKMGTGTKYLVIDAGGGTLDVTAHEILEGGDVKELHFATGGPLGGSRVDEAFSKLMSEIFSQDFIEYYKTSCASQWLQIISDFERKKRAVLAESDATTNIQLLWDFGTKYQSQKRQGVEKAFEKYKDKGVKFSNGQVCISADQTKSLFNPVVSGIVRHLKDLMKMDKLKQIKYFFLVGGFSECNLVQKAIFDHFKGVKVLVPEESSLAVLKGAVAFGHRPDAISSRISARTYGVGYTSEFIPGLHDKNKKIMIDGVPHVRNLFEIYVRRGQEVKMGYCKVSKFKPVRANQDEANTEVYSVDRDDVTYVNEQGVERHANICVDWPGHGTDRSIEISMTFGGTEIQVDATCQPGNRHTRTKVDFYVQD